MKIQSQQIGLILRIGNAGEHQPAQDHTNT
jgi:hypothetical protein